MSEVDQKRVEQIKQVEERIKSLQERVESIKEFRKNNDPALLRQEIEEYKDKIKKQEAQIQELKSQNVDKHDPPRVIASALFEFNADCDVQVGMY